MGNNNCGCAYDGGDCCGVDVKKTYCKECKCKDPKGKNLGGSCPGSCGDTKYKGDGNCDDNNNNCGCDYDGGDCCDSTAKGKKVSKTYCKECKCKDPKYKGDGNCDDNNNNCGCAYDGGDCCDSTAK